MNFKDFNFKLSIISALHELGYYVEEVAQIKDENDDWEEDHTPIPAVLEYYKNLEIDPAYLAEIESYLPDGGDLAYQYLTIAWDGEDDQFDIHSIEGIEHLVNLKTFDAISMIVADGLDYTPLLSCEKLEYVSHEYMRKDEKRYDLIRKFHAKGVSTGLPSDFEEMLDAQDARNNPGESDSERTMRHLLQKYLPVLDQATTFEAYYQACTELIAESEVRDIISLSVKEHDADALTTLKTYPYPVDFLEWHEKYGNTNVWLRLITIPPTQEITEQLEDYANVLTANKLLVLGSDLSGDSFMYNVAIPDHPQMMKLSHEQYYPQDLLDEFYSELLDFYWDDSTQTLHNPNELDEAEIWDENQNFKLDSKYIKDYLDAELEYVTDAEHFLQFLIARTKEALQDLQESYIQIRKEEERKWPIYYNQGLDYQRSKQYDLAEESFRKAISLKPNEESYTSLGQMLNARGDNEGAIDAYQKAIEIKPNHARAHNNLAFLYYELGRFQEANESVDKALQAEPDSGLYILTKAEIAFGMKDIEACYDALEKAAVLCENPKGVDAIIEKTLTKEKRYQEIIALYEHALDMQIDIPSTYLKKLKSKDKTVKKKLKLVCKEEENYQYWNDLGGAFFAIKDYDNALKCYTKGEEFKPHNYFSMINIGVCYNLKRDYESATVSYLRAMIYHPEKHKLWNNLANIYFQAKQNDKGFKAMQKAIELAPEITYHYPTLAYHYLLAGKVDESFEITMTGIRRGNSNSSYLNKAAFHLIKGEMDEALESYVRSYFAFKTPKGFWADFNSDFEVMPQYKIKRATYDALIPEINHRISLGLQSLEDHAAYWSRGINYSADLFEADLHTRYAAMGYPEDFLKWLKLGNHNYSSEVISGDIGNGFMFNIYNSDDLDEENEKPENSILLENDYLIFATDNAAEYYVFDKQEGYAVYSIASEDYLEKLPSIATIYQALGNSSAQQEFDQNPALKYEDEDKTNLRIRSEYVRNYIKTHLFHGLGKQYDDFMGFIQDKSTVVMDYLNEEWTPINQSFDPKKDSQRVISLRTFIETGKFGPVTLGMHKDQLVEALGTDFLLGDYDGAQILRYGTYEFFIYTESQTIFAIQNDSLSELLLENHQFSIEPWFLKEDDLPTFQEVKLQLESHQIPFEIRNTPSFNNEDYFYCTESRVTLDFREDPQLSPEDYKLTGIRLFE